MKQKIKHHRWQPLVPATHNPHPEQWVNDYASSEKTEVWCNDIYTVVVRRKLTEDNIPIAWLSIKRNDKEACRDWRHFQWIKNQLVGPECEGVELYPAENRLVDGSNQYHLWVFEDTAMKLPFGFDEGRQITRIPIQNGKQRAFPINMIPEDIVETEKRVEELKKSYQ